MESLPEISVSSGECGSIQAERMKADRRSPLPSAKTLIRSFKLDGQRKTTLELCILLFIGVLSAIYARWIFCSADLFPIEFQASVIASDVI